MEELIFVLELSLLIIGVWLVACLVFVGAFEGLKWCFNQLKKGVRRWIIA